MRLLEIGLILAAALVLFAAARNPKAEYLAVAAAGIGAASPSFSFHVGMGHIHYFVLAALLCLPHVRTWRLFRERIGKSLIACSGLVALTAFVGPLTNSRTLWFVLLADLTASFVVATVCAKSARNQRTILRYFVFAVSAGVIIAILQALHVIHTGLVHFDVISSGRPTGIFGEPDWLGLYSATALIILLRGRSLFGRGLIPLSAVNTIGLALSFARAAWVGLLVALILATPWARLFSLSVRISPRRIAVIVGSMVVGVSIVGSFANVRQTAVERVTSLVSPAPADIAIRARTEQIDSLNSLLESAPWYGDGLSASGRVGVSGIIQYTGQAPNNVGTNWILDLLVDAKLLAIPMIVTLLVLAARAATTVPGSVLALVLVNSLFSDAFYFPIFWLFAALSIVELQRKRERRADGVPVPAGIAR